MIHPKFISFLFVLLVVFLYTALLLLLRWALAQRQYTAANIRRVMLWPRIGLAGWFLLTGFLAMRGIFSDFQSTPPKIALVVAPALVGTLLLGLGHWFRETYDHCNPRVIVGLQSFRIVMEIILYLLFLNNSLPKLLTFEGRNFDMIVGLSAPIVTRLWMKPGYEKWGWVFVWNMAGLALVINVATHGILAAPTSFQVFDTSPPNTVIADFPYIWLPTFVVPMAIFLHIVSIRHCLSNLKKPA
ncbi:MAG: hypothetical protein HUU55_15550 [Myxococcales bacterium]|nr:hypothetical protein [Myxococcales bacterium]